MFKGWLGGTTTPKHVVSTRSLSALEEPQALEQALKAMSLLMDDDVIGAEAALEDGTSSFHKLAGGVIAFLRASLGFEAEVMKEASDRLADAEASAERDRKKAVRENHHSCSYPPGTEFVLCYAEAQLMSAVVGVLSESVVESMRAFYKLRSAYKTLEGIHQTAAATALAASANASKVSLLKERGGSSEPLTPGSLAEDIADLKLAEGRGGKVKSSRASVVSNVESLHLSNPLDAFIHSGTNLCFGILLLILGMVPPSLGKVMSIVGFRGDREKGLQMLWEAAKADNIHGAIAVLVILQFYGNVVQFCDILPEADHPSGRGYPKQKCHLYLARLREKYPRSALWKLEEARMEAVGGGLEKAVLMLSEPADTQMRQVEALMVFEKSLNCMYLHRYEEVADGFLKLTKLNNWSHGLYHYFAAACHVELYRKYYDTDKTKAEKHAAEAEHLIEKVPTFMGKKRFMAQGLPLEIFAERKIKKWQARAIERGVRLVDGVGVSPVEEMMYFWNGFKKMGPKDFETSLDALQWRKEEIESDSVDEQAIRWLLMSLVLRNMGQLEKGRSYMDYVVGVDKTKFKGLNNDEWMAPASHYETAVFLWKEHGPTKENTEEVKKWLTKAATWGPYELDARIGLRVSTALDTVNKYLADFAAS
ncbi:Mitochondrial outer membrane protein iml2 [Rhizina undulata]